MVCTFCGTPNPASAGFCATCGRPLWGDSGTLTPSATIQPMPAVPGSPRVGRQLVKGWLLGLACFLPVLVLLWLVRAVPDAGKVALVLGATFLPAVVYGALALAVGRDEQKQWVAIVAAFAGGAIGATLLSSLAELVIAGGLVLALGVEAAGVVTVVVVAPVVEESCKGLVVLLLMLTSRRVGVGVAGGLMYGALVGNGFETTENFGYFLMATITRRRDDAQRHDHRPRGPLRLWPRAADRDHRRRARLGARPPSAGAARVLVPLAGLAAAMLLHVLWNGGATVIAALQMRDGMPRLLAVGGVNALRLPPGGGDRPGRAPPRDRRGRGPHAAPTTRTEVDRGVLTARELDVLANRRRWRQAAWLAWRNGGQTAWDHQRRFRQLALRLASRMRDAELAWRASGGRVWSGYNADVPTIRALRQALGLMPGPGPADILAASPLAGPSRSLRFAAFVALTWLLDGLAGLASDRRVLTRIRSETIAPSFPTRPPTRPADMLGASMAPRLAAPPGAAEPAD